MSSGISGDDGGGGVMIVKWADKLKGVQNTLLGTDTRKLAKHISNKLPKRMRKFHCEHSCVSCVCVRTVFTERILFDVYAFDFAGWFTLKSIGMVEFYSSKITNKFHT